MLEDVRSVQYERPALSRLAGNIVFYFGVVVTLSWAMGLPLLWFGGWSTRVTRPNSGFGFLLAGLALRLVQEDSIGGTWKVPEIHLKFTVRRTVQVLGTVLVLIGVLTLTEYILRRDLHIGTVLVFQKWLREIDPSAARMTTLTAVEFLLAGTGLLLHDRRFKKKFFPSELIFAIVLTISLDSLIAFLYMSDTVPDIRSDSPIPMLSSIMFIVLSVGMLASRQNRGMVAVWVAKYNGSMLVRKWLPLGLLVFILTGEIADILQDYKFLEPGVSLSVFTVVVISFTAVVVLFSAVHLNDSEKQLLHANRLYAVLSQSNQIIVRTKDKAQLLDSICGIMVRLGSFGTSWIKMTGTDGGESRLDACSGEGCPGFAEDDDSLRAFMEARQVHRVVEGAEYSLFNDVENDDLPDAVRERMLELRHRSMAIFRLSCFGKTAGLLGVCSEETGYFGRRETDLLREVAMDLSFALEGLERENRKDMAEKALRDSEDRFRATFERAAVGIVLLTPRGVITKANPRFCEITGYTEAELTGRSFVDITHEEDVGKDISMLERIIKGEITTYSAEKRYIKKDGSPLWAHLSAALARDSDGEPKNLISIVQDISERKEAEELLRKSREQYQRFFEEDITADYIATIDGKILSCNPAFARIFGFSSVEEAIEANVNDLYTSPALRTEFLRLLQDAGKIEYQEITLRKKDGSEIFVIRSAFGVFDQNGKLVQTKNYLFDDTRRRTLERQMLQAQKMESLGTLAGGIAHDFNNILGIIMGHAGLLKRNDLSGERAARSIEAIDSATRRGAGLIRQLLTFARKEERAFESVDINEIVKDLHKLLEEAFPRLISIRLGLAEGLAHVTGDPNQIHQALLNLCVNARDAMLDRKDGKIPGGILSISTSVEKGERVRESFSNAARERYVCVTVTDTGIGIDDTTGAHIFEPFFTTKERGKGTGLGLATVYGIVEGHEGFIDMTSEPGMGTRFTIYFPEELPGAGQANLNSCQTNEIRGGDETILVVEDEEMLTDFLKEILAPKGYKVLTAQDGETAVSIFAANLGKIDLVLSDLGLPRLRGEDMLVRLKEIDPDVRVIFASGFMEPDTKSAISEAGAHDFIQKPYSAVEVLTKVREVLDGISKGH